MRRAAGLVGMAHHNCFWVVNYNIAGNVNTTLLIHERRMAKRKEIGDNREDEPESEESTSEESSSDDVPTDSRSSNQSFCPDFC